MLLTTLITASQNQQNQTPVTTAEVVPGEEILPTDFFNEEYDSDELLDLDSDDEFNLDGDDDEFGDIFLI